MLVVLPTKNEKIATENLAKLKRSKLQRQDCFEFETTSVVESNETIPSKKICLISKCNSDQPESKLDRFAKAMKKSKKSKMNKKNVTKLIHAVSDDVSSVPSFLDTIANNNSSLKLHGFQMSKSLDKLNIPIESKKTNPPNFTMKPIHLKTQEDTSTQKINFSIKPAIQLIKSEMNCLKGESSETSIKQEEKKSNKTGKVKTIVHGILGKIATRLITKKQVFNCIL